MSSDHVILSLPHPPSASAESQSTGGLVSHSTTEDHSSQPATNIQSEQSTGITSSNDTSYLTGSGTGSSENTKVFYRNLSTEATEDAIKALFIPYGSVQDFILLKNPATHKSKGAGFVRYNTATEASAAITGLNGTVPSIGVSNIGSSTMEVRYPESTAEKSSRTRNPPMHNNNNPRGSSGYMSNPRYPGGGNTGYGSRGGPVNTTNPYASSSNAYGTTTGGGYSNPYGGLPTTINPTNSTAAIPYGYTLPPSSATTASPYGQVPVGYTMNPYGFYIPNPTNPYAILPNPANPYGTSGGPAIIPGGVPPSGTGNETTIFVHGFPEGYTEVELSALFANSGTVTSSKIVLDKVTGKPRDYGFVTFATHDGALQAVKLNNIMMPHGRKLRVEVKSGGMDKSSGRHGGGMPRNTGSGGYEGGGGGYRGNGGYGRR